MRTCVRVYGIDKPALLLSQVVKYESTLDPPAADHDALTWSQ